MRRSLGYIIEAFSFPCRIKEKTTAKKLSLHKLLLIRPRFQLVHCCLPLQHLPPRLHPPPLHIVAALSLGHLFLRRPPLFLSSLIFASHRLLSQSLPIGLLHYCLPLQHLPPHRHPPPLHIIVALYLDRLFVPRPPLFLSSLSLPLAIPAISLPSLPACTKSCRCSPTAPAFCSQSLPPAAATTALVLSKKITVVALVGHNCCSLLQSPLLPVAFPPTTTTALLQHRYCSPPLYRPPTTRRT
ncbi:hypothetical protein BHM03_00025876 [Ensete ventricosum]|nr:hypothetical protein BHM03_00025876 [Ensete ventricosum]